MTPTEQDEELREQIYALDRLRVKIDPNLPRIGSVMARVDDIVALITADRKRVALEARLDEWNLIGETLHAALIESERHVEKVRNDRLSALKAQQEET